MWTMTFTVLFDGQCALSPPSFDCKDVMQVRRTESVREHGTPREEAAARTSLPQLLLSRVHWDSPRVRKKGLDFDDLVVRQGWPLQR